MKDDHEKYAVIESSMSSTDIGCLINDIEEAIVDDVCQ